MVRAPVFSALAVLALTVLPLTGCAGASGSSEQEAMPDPLEDIEAQELYRHGLGMAQRGDLVRAEQYILAAIERGFDKREALPTLLRICIASQRFGLALRHAEPFLEAHPDDWALRYLVATLYLALRRAERAQVELEKVIRDAPQQAVPYYTLGMLHRDQFADPDAARQYLTRYVELAPTGEHAAEVRAMLDEPQEMRRNSVPEPTNEPTNRDPTAEDGV